MPKFKIVYFDIETLPLKGYFWQPGQQYVGHSNLIPSHSMWDLICIQYAINDGPVKVLRYDKHGGAKDIIEKFDAIIADADVVLGKNSDRFDVKMLNAMRLFLGVKSMLGWEKYTEDLEKQMRRYLRLPSQSLDYISKQLGVGGKHRMEMGDWIDISRYKELTTLKSSGLDVMTINIVSKYMFKEKASDIIKAGKVALDKMCNYGAKDTEDTRTIWKYCQAHFDPKFNRAKWVGEKHACKRCGEGNIKKNGTRVAGKTLYQHFYCNDCGMYAGRAPISKTGVVGQIG